MLVRFVVALLLFCYCGESESLQSLWENGAENPERCRDLCVTYLSRDGFIQWKSDGKYLMSGAFLSEFLAEGGSPDTRTVTLSRYWISGGLTTGGFDRYHGSEWPEENRDAAIPVVMEMVAVYQEFLQQMPIGLAKTELEDTIEDLERLASYFKCVIDPKDMMKRAVLKKRYR
jgi:hypothetical protein